MSQHAITDWVGPDGQYFNPFFPTAVGTDLTPDDYWNAQPAKVRELRDTPMQDRLLKAQVLALDGYLVNLEVMVMGNDPRAWMALKKRDGYAWYPSITGAIIQIAPGLTMPGVPTYDPGRPAPNSMLVSTDKRDFPPIEQPKAPDAPPQLVDHSLVGGYLFDGPDGKIYSIRYGADAAKLATLKNGEIVVEGAHTYKAKVGVSLMALQEHVQYFTLVS